MIFDFIKEKAIDKKEAIHDHILGTSIMDRFLRLVGTVLVLGLGIVIAINGIYISSSGIDAAGWLLPLVIVLLIIDLLFLHWVTPWIWKGIVFIFETLWSIIQWTGSLILELIGGIISFAIGIFDEILSVFLGKK